MVWIRVNDVERNSSFSFDSERQVELTIFAQFEKPEALVTSKKLVGKKPNLHCAISRYLQCRNDSEVRVWRSGL
jgi:hypothetical protein